MESLDFAMQEVQAPSYTATCKDSRRVLSKFDWNIEFKMFFCCMIRLHASLQTREAITQVGWTVLLHWLYSLD